MSPPSRSSTLFSEADSIDSQPSVSRLYNDAAEFERLLVHSGCIKSPVSDNKDDSFAEFIGHELIWSEQEKPSDRLMPEATTASEDGAQQYEQQPLLKMSPQSTVHLTETQEQEPWHLKPNTIVHLITEEFGSLVVDSEEETLLMDTDGCLMGGVVVVGALHLTTHRLAFHASLCKCRRGLASARHVLKSGTAILHRKKWKSRRRVWLELATDMLCVYRSSNQDASSRPLHSILFGLVDEIVPVDSEHRTYLSLVLGAASLLTSITFEFDTLPSAQDWRRELRGALFLSRHQRRNRSDGTSSQDSVRFSCPLNRIDLVTSSPFLDVLTRVSLHIPFTRSDVITEGDELLGAHILQIGVLRHIPLASELAYLTVAAKHRFNTDIFKTPVFLDLGPFSILEREVRSTITCSNLGVRDNPLSRAHEGRSRLWFCPTRLVSATQSSGYLVVTPTHIGFWSKDLTRCRPKDYLPFSAVEGVQPFRIGLCRLNGMNLKLNSLHGRANMLLAFDCPELRDEAMYRIKEFLPLVDSEKSQPASRIGDQALFPRPDITNIIAPLSRSLATAIKASLPMDVKLNLPKAINIPSDVLGKRSPLHFVCLTIGSRGDVQPYIALGLGLKKQGHRVTIVTHEEYRKWIEDFGIQHRTAGGDPGRLMKLSVENKMFSPEFFKKVLYDYRSWLDELLVEAWEACQDADVLLESPSAMAGVHIAEALRVPYFRTFTMPWTKTSEFPHPFLSPPGGSAVFNSASYVLFNNVLWCAISGQINRWRETVLALGQTEMGHQSQSKLTYIYDFSQAVVPKPLDWGDNIIIAGYWFLDNAEVDWTPPSDFLQWMERAKLDGKPIVYIGFGSITIPRPHRLMAQIVKAVTQSDVRAVITKGWSTRMSHIGDIQEVALPPDCYVLDKVPHDWLFPRIDAAMHHGGAGTTGASLRAGIPTLIKPWFGDQYFWGSRVEKLGAGIRLNSFRVQEMSDALTRATRDNVMKEKAAQIGSTIRAEDGVHTSIYAIYSRLDSQISRKS